MTAARAERPVKIPTKKAALRLVASHLAGNLGASTTDEILNSVEVEESLTPAEVKRLDWAVDEVTRRLYTMGGRS
jgi:hypothetical protein